MTTPLPGFVRYALLRFAGFAATIGLLAVLLPALLGTEPLFDAAIVARLAVTLPLAGLALLFAAVIGVPAGYAAARRRGTIADSAIMLVARLLLAAPAVWLGMVLVLVVAGMWRWLPTGGFVPWGLNAGGALMSLMLPATAIALPLAGLMARAARRAFTAAETVPVVTLGRVLGATEARATFATGARLSAAPLLGVLASQFGVVLGGALIIENVFYLPGLGRLLFVAVAEQDLGAVGGALLTMLGIVALVQLIADVARAAIDPRVVT